MRLKRAGYLPYLILVLLALSFSGCSTASVGTPSGFLQDYSDFQNGIYFKQEYIPKGTSFSGYKTVKVAPVNLNHLDDQSSCDTGDLENLAREFREDVEAQLKNSGFTVTSDPSGRTLVLSLALTNIETPDRLFNAGMTAASIMSPVPLPFDKDGKTAVEGKITDGATGQLLMEFAEVRSGAGDKRSLKTLTVGKYQKFTNTQAVFAGWAQTLAKMLQNLTAQSGTV
ncbi:MAG: hypothetical protein A2351_04250 [Omnitrophica bacterium RIFOXYB12_FULL_50_7]|nr:MAG: hypothetical protein A2351_04250 [Omnitrophica bacterium RIFOXYB12_FULL_50_7]